MHFGYYDYYYYYYCSGWKVGLNSVLGQSSSLSLSSSSCPVVVLSYVCGGGWVVRSLWYSFHLHISRTQLVDGWIRKWKRKREMERVSSSAALDLWQCVSCGVLPSTLRGVMHLHGDVLLLLLLCTCENTSGDDDDRPPSTTYLLLPPTSWNYSLCTASIADSFRRYILFRRNSRRE